VARLDGCATPKSLKVQMIASADPAQIRGASLHEKATEKSSDDE
jgi:hypothetical protein